MSIIPKVMLHININHIPNKDHARKKNEPLSIYIYHSIQWTKIKFVEIAGS